MGIIQKIKSTFFALKVFKNYLEKCRRREELKENQIRWKNWQNTTAFF